MPEESRPAARIPIRVSPAGRAAAEVGRAAARLQHQVEQALKPYDLTATQYNVLRILNGARPNGLCGTDIGNRLISRVPDMTRLLDRMAEAGLIERERDPRNRRFVTAHLTAAGEAKLVETTPVVEALNREQFRRLSAEQIATCLSLMGLIAAPADDQTDSA
jgi:MarR family transcriptional regulator, organic hydroperoxide resistance regulator